MPLGCRRFVMMVLALALQKPLAAQRLATVQIDSGTLIRVHLTKGETVRGRLPQTFAPESPTLILCRIPSPRCASFAVPPAHTVPAADVTRLDVSRGSNWVGGLFVGGAIVAIVGALVASDFGTCEIPACHESTRRWAFRGFLVGASLGIAVGSGSVYWRPAP